jgi:Thermostable hemolysin
MDRIAIPLADGRVNSVSPVHRAPLGCIEQLARNHPRRACLERFIAEVYLWRYGARIDHFAEQLIARRDEAGNWLAAAGYTPATDAPLFVEQYLNVPVEEALTARIGAPVARHQVVEAGNLAAVGPGAARNMIVSLALLLHRLQLGWVVLTGTRTLRNTFFRLGLAPLALVHASPQRLSDCGSSWGSYFQTDPVVVAADITAGFLSLQARHRIDVRV